MPQGEVERYKARLAVKGYNKQEGLDYSETFSPVAKMVTVRSVVALASSYGWFLFQMDVHNVFLQSDLVEEVYIQVPDEFANRGEKHMVCKLKGSGLETD